jgi:hypothetical protein
VPLCNLYVEIVSIMNKLYILSFSTISCDLSTLCCADYTVFALRESDTRFSTAVFFHESVFPVGEIWKQKLVVRFAAWCIIVTGDKLSPVSLIPVINPFSRFSLIP